MKRTCNYCRALDERFGKCTLGFKCKAYYYTVWSIDNIDIPMVKYIPQEDCPKPTTFTAYEKCAKKEGK